MSEAGTVQVHVGETMEEVATRFLDGWNRLERGEAVEEKLAQALGRDDRRVHADVEALVGAGLLDRDEGGLRAEYGAFHAETRVAL